MPLTPDGWSTRRLVLTWLIPVVLGLPFSLISLGATPNPPAFWRVALIGTVCWQVWVPISMVVGRLADRIPLDRLWTPRVIAIHAVTALCACVTQAGATAVTSHLLAPTPGQELSGLFMWWGLILTPAGVIVYGAIVAVRLAQRRERQVTLLSHHLAEARLLSLRAQLRPHFLFNTLNAIVALVRDGERDAAADALVRVGGLLRSSLRNDARRTVPLAEELAFVAEYLRIEQMRLGDRLLVEIDAEPAVQAAEIPPMLLQPLVENAIRHGVARVRGPVSVRISVTRNADALWVRVTDDGAGLSAGATPGTGLGMQNVRARLEHMFPGRSTLALLPNPAGRGAVAEVRLPWLEYAA